MVNKTVSYPSITLEFELYCENAWKKELLLTAWMLNILCSLILFGWVGDKYGRKPSMVYCYLIGSVSFFLIGFSPNYWIALLFYFLSGTSFPFVWNSSIYV